MHISRVNCDIMGKKREDLGRGKLAEMAEIQNSKGFIRSGESCEISKGI